MQANDRELSYVEEKDAICLTIFDCNYKRCISGISSSCSYLYNPNDQVSVIKEDGDI